MANKPGKWRPGQSSSNSRQDDENIAALGSFFGGNMPMREEQNPDFDPSNPDSPMVIGKAKGLFGKFASRNASDPGREFVNNRKLADYYTEQARAQALAQAEFESDLRRQEAEKTAAIAAAERSKEIAFTLNKADADAQRAKEEQLNNFRDYFSAVDPTIGSMPDATVRQQMQKILIGKGIGRVAQSGVEGATAADRLAIAQAAGREAETVNMPLAFGLDKSKLDIAKSELDLRQKEFDWRKSIPIGGSGDWMYQDGKLSLVNPAQKGGYDFTTGAMIPARNPSLTPVVSDAERKAKADALMKARPTTAEPSQEQLRQTIPAVNQQAQLSLEDIITKLIPSQRPPVILAKPAYLNTPVNYTNRSNSFDPVMDQASVGPGADITPQTMARARKANLESRAGTHMQALGIPPTEEWGKVQQILGKVSPNADVRQLQYLLKLLSNPSTSY